MKALFQKYKQYIVVVLLTTLFFNQNYKAETSLVQASNLDIKTADSSFQDPESIVSINPATDNIDESVLENKEDPTTNEINLDETKESTEMKSPDILSLPIVDESNVVKVDSFTSLQETIALINNGGQNNIVKIMDDITLTGAISIKADITLIADRTVTLTSGTGYRHFLVSGSDVTVTFDENVVLNGGGISGGISSSAAMLTLNHAVIKNCYSTGGGVYGYGESSGAESFILIKDNVEISGNTARCGGAIYSNRAAVYVTGNARITNNIATSTGVGTHGGGIGCSSNVNISGDVVIAITNPSAKAEEFTIPKAAV